MRDQSTQVETTDVAAEASPVLRREEEAEEEDNNSELDESFMSALSYNDINIRRHGGGMSPQPFVRATTPAMKSARSSRSVRSPPSSVDKELWKNLDDAASKETQEDENQENQENQAWMETRREYVWSAYPEYQQDADHYLASSTSEEDVENAAPSPRAPSPRAYDNPRLVDEESSVVTTEAPLPAAAPTELLVQLVATPVIEVVADVVADVAEVPTTTMTEEEKYRFAGTGLSPLDALPKEELQSMLYAYWKDRQSQYPLYTQEEEDAYYQEYYEEYYQEYYPEYSANQENQKNQKNQENQESWLTTETNNSSFTQSEPVDEKYKERRTDPADGYAYTIEEFLAHYGGVREWKAAQVWVDTESTSYVNTLSTETSDDGSWMEVPKV